MAEVRRAPNRLHQHIKQDSINTTAYAEFTFQDTTDSCILAVVGNLFSTAAGANKHAKSGFRVIDGTTERSVWNYNMDTGSAGAINGMGSFIPPTGTAWTTSSLNGLVGRVGYTSEFPNGAAAPRWDALGIEYLAIPTS